MSKVERPPNRKRTKRIYTVRTPGGDLRTIEVDMAHEQDVLGAMTEPVLMAKAVEAYGPDLVPVEIRDVTYVR